VSGPSRSKKPKGLRRLERWIVGLAMGVIAFVLEKSVRRSVKKGGGDARSPERESTTITSKGGEVDVPAPDAR
jgi:hypothetical protein